MPVKCLVAALFCFSSGAELVAQEREVDFTYAELRYLDDGASRYSTVSGSDGPQIGGSYQISSDLLIFGSYSSREIGAFEFTELELGGGMILSGLIDWDIIARAAIVQQEFTVDFNGTIFDVSEKETGVRVSAGVRDFFLNHIDALAPLEFRGSVNLQQVGDFDAFLEAGADYHFSPGFSAGLQLEVGGDAEIVSAGIRWFF